MRIVRTVAALALVVALGACAKSSNTNESPSPSEAAATTAPAVATPAASGAATGATTVKKSDSGILTDSKGMSLYTFDNDTAGKSNCTDTCAQTWPPLAFTGSGTPTGADNLATTTRADGTKQVTWKDKPLYTYSGDTNPGDKNGDGFAGKWHLAKAS